MTSRWFLIDERMMDSLAALQMGHREFRKKFTASLRGEENELTPFVRGPYSRPPTHEWRELRETVFKRDDFTCRYCGERGGRLECDHVVPVAKGGESDLDNLATACFSCNRAKRSKTVEEWRPQ